MLIKILNNLHDGATRTYLASPSAVGATSLTVRNNAGFTTSYAIQIGEVGNELSEAVIGTSAGSATLNVPALNFAHPADTPIYHIKFDQVVFQKSTTGTAGSATSITGGTITYQSDHAHTVFDDTAGASTDAYRTRFRNSALGSQTSQSDWITSAGFSFYSLIRMRERVKEKLWSSAYLSDSAIDNWINEWKDEMTTSAIAVNEDYSIGTVDVAFGTAGLGTVTTADFSQIRRVEITYNGNDYYLSVKQQVNDFLPNQVFSSTHPVHNWVGDTVIQVHPPESGGTARMWFYRFGTTMVNDTDELALTLRPYTKSFVDYVLAQAFLKDSKLSEYDRMIQAAGVAKQNFINQLAPRDKSGPSLVDIVDTLGQNDDFWP